MMFEKLLATIIEISITTSFVIALLLVVSPLIKKTYIAKWRYFVWIILAVRLIIPFNVTLPTPPVTLATPNNTIVFRQPTTATTQTETIVQTNIQTLTLNTHIKDISLMDLFTIMWLFGILVFILYHMIVYISFKKQVKRWSSEITNEQINSIFERICDELNLKRKPKLKLCKKVSSPMMFGFRTPFLLLPSESYNPNDLEVILKHELIHFNRKDLWYKLILLISNAIHWFNPLVYFMLKSANVDVEISCDNEVIKNSDIAFRKSYSQTILTVLHHAKLHQSALSTYFVFSGNKKTMKKRFENIFDMGKKKQGIVALCLVLMLTVTSGVFVACRSDNSQGKTVSELLYSKKTAFVGDNSKVIAMVDLLTIPSGIVRDTTSLKTENEPYGIKINYKNDISDALATDAENKDWLYKNAVIVFSLIGNVDKIRINIESEMFGASESLEITRIDAEEFYGGGDLREFAKTLESFKSFLAKVDGMELTTSENTTFKGLELYVWKNRTVTGNEDTYFTLFFGTDKMKTEDEVYDLSIAVNDTEEIKERLEQYSDKMDGLSLEINTTTHFTKDEMLKISEKLNINSIDMKKALELWKE